jgi:hypothetical protein
MAFPHFFSIEGKYEAGPVTSGRFAFSGGAPVPA